MIGEIYIKQLEILKNNNIDFTSEKVSSNITLLKVGKIKKKNIVLLISKDTIFKLKREFFNYLDGNPNPYGFWFINSSYNEMYYLEFRDKINWLSTSFSRTEKSEIYFGKEVLNNKKSKAEIINILKDCK